MNIGRKSLSFVLAAALIFGVAMVGTATAAVVYTDAAEGSYYSSITATGGTALLGQVHDLIVSTHTKYTSYDECKTKGTTTDPGLDGKGYLEFYTHETLTSFGGSVGTANREHVWCQSLSNGLWGTSGAGSDMHHIRPSESSLNSTRGNNKYGKVTSGKKEAYSKKSGGAQSKLGGYVGGGVFEPLDNVKGDAARIVMYVYTHYNKGKNVGGTLDSRGSGTLNFTNVMAASSEAAARELLLEWNALDPVDAIEEKRNEEVFKIQGNRNPFIDHPEYASAIWGDGKYDPPVSDVKPTSLSITPSAVTMSVGGTANLTVTPTPSNASKEVKWSVYPTNVVTIVDGKLTAYAEGQATVTATSTLDQNVKATASVTVKKAEGGGSAAGSFIIDRSSVDTGGSNYAFHDWSAGSVKGIAYIYTGNKDAMQFNSSKDSYYIASTTAALGPITKVTVKGQEDKDEKSWKLLTSSTPYGEVAKKPANGNDRGTKTVTENGVTWEVTGSDTYFALTYEDSSAAYLNSITVEYGPSQGETPPPHVHHFEYENVGDKDDHITTCTGCDYGEIEPHVYSSDTDTTCDLCGYVRTVHTHEYQYTPLDDTYHTVTCKDCDKLNDREVHVYSDSTDTTCNKCGYERTLGGEHVHTKQYEDIDDTYHRVTCDCGIDEREAHEYTDDADPTCNLCGHVRAIVDEEKLAAFHTAVEGVKTEGALSARRQSLLAALNAYNALSDDEKEAAADDYAALSAAVEAYDADVEAMNEAAQEANDLFAPKKKGEKNA